MSMCNRMVMTDLRAGFNLSLQAKFQNEHGHKRRAGGKEFGIAEVEFGHGKRALWSEGNRYRNID